MTHETETNKAILRNRRMSYFLSEIWNAGSISRSRLGEITGLALPSVTRLVQDLKDAGIIIEIDKGISSGGRQPSLIRINPDIGVVFGLDFSGIELRGAILDAGNQCLCVIQQPFKGMQPDIIRDQTIDLCRELIANPVIANRPVLGIGISIPGIVDIEKGIIRDSSNLHLKNYPIREVLEKELGIPVILEHDTLAAALAEKYYGAGRGASDLMYVIVSAGIGAGLIIHNEIYRGSNGMAGELGHVIMERDGQVCACGKHGCLEALASVSAMLSFSQNVTFRQNAPAIQSSRQVVIEPITVKAVTQAAIQGDTLTQAIINRAADYLALAVNMVVSVLDIPLVIIGGEVVEMGQVFFEPFNKSLAKYRGDEPAIKAVQAILGENATIQGMGILVLERVLMKIKDLS